MSAKAIEIKIAFDKDEIDLDISDRLELAVRFIRLLDRYKGVQVKVHEFEWK